MKKELKNKKISLIIIIVSIIIFLFIIWILAFPKLSPRDKNDSFIEEKKEQKEDENDTEDTSNDIPEEYADYYPQITETSDYFDTYLFKKYPVENIENLSQIDKTLFLLNIICTEENPKVTIQQVTENMNKYFVPFDLYLGNIQDSSDNILYKYENGTYTYENSEEDLPYRMYTRELSNKASFDSWIVQRKVYYIKGEMKNKKIKLNVYKDHNLDEIIYSYNSESNLSLSSLPNEGYQKIKDELSTITYTYKRIGETYILQSISLK